MTPVLYQSAVALSLDWCCYSSAMRVRQCLRFLRLVVCWSISEGGINHLTSIKTSIYPHLSPYLCLIEYERTQRVDLWKCFAVICAFVQPASLLHLWFIFYCICKWIACVYVSWDEEVFKIVYCQYTACLLESSPLFTHDFSLSVVLNNSHSWFGCIQLEGRVR